MNHDPVRRGLDRLGWLELTGTGIWFGGVLALQVAQLVSVIRDEAAPGTTTWLTAAAAGTVVAVVAMLLVAREWRKHGGRALQRLGRRVWMSGRLPVDLRTRVAVLRDLERRERKLERAGIPVWAFALFWTALVAWHLASQPTPS